MIKKSLIVLALLWVAFLGIMIFREKIVEFLGGSTKPKEIVKQEIPQVVPPQPVKVEPKTLEVIPFEPLPDKPTPPPPMLVREVKKEVIPVEKATNQETQSEKVEKIPEPTFGLICTKYERIPSRFRLASWEGVKKVELEDLSKIDPVTKRHPRYWLRLRVPYKELIHVTSKESFFRPTNMQDPNKRLLVQSFEVKKEALSYSTLKKPIGYLILRDFKIGGPPFQLTSEMDSPMTSSYYLHFEQIMGPKKFFHDLTGKRNGHKFGGWGIEYQVTNQNFAQNKITVLRKDLKTLKLAKKDLSGPTSL